MQNEIIGIRSRKTGNLMLFVDGKAVELKPSLEAWNHSPSGFNAGYLGSGPAQSALGILLHVLKDKTIAIRLHQKFKQDFLANPKYEHSNFSFRLDVKEWAKKNG